MAQRKQLALFFSYNENWIGGTYYILNLVHALNVLEDIKKPVITIVGNHISDYKYIKKETLYPYLEFNKNKSYNTLLQKAINAISLRLVKRKWVEYKLEDKYDLLFPISAANSYLSNIDKNKIVDWIPDFQDFHLPHLYDPESLVEVRQRNVAKAYLSKRIVLSSKDAEKDFRTYYPDSKAQIFVIPFSVTHPSLAGVDFMVIKDKYEIKNKYFYAPNQYWVHKNHTYLIDVIYQLKKKHPNILLLFSGKEWDHRNPNYVPELKQKVKDLNLEENIKFLGFLDRKEQLLIMKNAQAIIQPSLFEGWSTVIEDAKALNKFVFASDIAVHREQLNENVVFFDPYDSHDLVSKINESVELEIINIDYRQSILNHARDIMKLF